MGIHLPGRVLGLVRSDAGVRAAVLEGTTLRLLDATPFETNVRLVQRNVTDAWMSTGRVGEIYLTYRGARGVGGVISFLAVHPSARPAIVERLSVKNAYGPAFLANSGLSVLVDPRDGVTPPTVAPASTATGRRDRDDDDHNHSCEDDDRDDRGRR
jgi:hypothetical protein